MSKFREMIAVCGVLCSFLIVDLAYGGLPALIPTPINGAGDIHGLGPKNHLWLLVGLSVWVYVLMSLVILVPEEMVNSSRPLSAAQKRRVRNEVLAVTGWLKALTMLYFALFAEYVVRRAQGMPYHFGHALKCLLTCLAIAVVATGVTRIRRALIHQSTRELKSDS